MTLSVNESPVKTLELWVAAGSLDDPESGIAAQTAFAVASQALGTSELASGATTWEVAGEYSHLSFSTAATQALEFAERVVEETLREPKFASAQVRAFHAAHYRPETLSVIVSAGESAASKAASSSLTDNRTEWTPLARLAGPDNLDAHAQASLELAAMVLSLRLESQGLIHARARFERRRSGSALIWERRSGASANQDSTELEVLRRHWEALRTDLIRLEELTRAKQLVAAQRERLYPQANREPWRLGYGLCLAGDPRWWEQYLDALSRVNRNDIQALCQRLE